MLEDRKVFTMICLCSERACCMMSLHCNLCLRQTRALLMHLPASSLLELNDLSLYTFTF